VKVLFAGPSLWGVTYDRSGLDVRPPARQGDIHRAVVEGTDAIGLIDGVFGFVPSVWHKEILFALKSGVRVMGAASLGALRAAECAPFGMEVVGSIAQSYADGSRIEDADVCLVHAPAELDFMPLTEPLVDVEATVGAMRLRGLASPGEADALLAAARSTYFADRTVETVTLAAGMPELAPRYREARVGAKSADALLLVDRLRAARNERLAPPGWELVSSEPWRNYLAASGSSPA
jgi:hypothetical protein